VEEQDRFLEMLSNLTANVRGPGTDRAHDGTCEWIFEHKNFIQWRKTQEGSLLFLLGPSGCGKTIISNFVSKRLKQEGRFVISFYCKDATGKDRTPPVVETFIYRYLNEDRRLFRHVPPKYKWKRDPIAGDPSLKLDAWEIFENILEDIEAMKVYLFLDGLDECDEAFVNGLLKHLEGAFGPTANNIARQAGVAKIMLSCRPRWNIPECASRFSIIDVGRKDSEADSAHFITKDIELYVRAELGQIAQARNYSEELKQSVESKILQKANGMFLWVSLVLDQLRNGRYQANRATVEGIVDRFPTNMDRYYSQTLEDILKSSPEEFKEILRAVLFQVRPMRSQDLAVALAIRSDQRSILQLSSFVDHDIVNWVAYNTGGLLKMNEDTCELVHFSFREFLESISRGERVVHLRRFQFNKAASHLDMARRCIYYLMFEDFQGLSGLSQPQRNRVLDTQPFISYAIDCWPLHVKLAGDLIDLEYDLLTRFLAPNSSFYKNWDRIYRTRCGWNSKGNSTPLLHYIAEFGLMNLLSRVKLLRNVSPVDSFQDRARFYLRRKWYEFKGAMKGIKMFPYAFDIDMDDDSKLTALDRACLEGQLGVVNHLLNVGAWCRGTYAGYYTPFQIALKAGHQDVALRIWAEGNTSLAVANQADDMARPIHYACASGLQLLVCCLLLFGVDLNVSKSTGETPLYLAIENGHTGIVRLLLRAGAAPRPISVEGPFSLHLAVQRGNFDIVNMLLEAGAEFDAYNEIGLLPIHYAAAYDHPDIVRLLKAKGADINLVGIKVEGVPDEVHAYAKWSALHIAALEGGSSTIRALTECGADISAKNAEGATALVIVSTEGGDEAAEYLLNAGSPVNEPDAEGCTPLFKATQNGHLAIVRSLLRRGADPDIPLLSSRISPLHIAAWENRVEIVTELLRKSADVEARTIVSNGWTPLFPAAHKGHDQVVQLLIDFDANPTAVTVDQNSSILETAVSGGHCDTVKLLMDSGATVRRGSAKRPTALHQAAIDGRADIVEVILDREKNAVDLETETGETPLYYACANGHDDIAEILLNAGANPKAISSYGIAIFHVAAQCCKLPLVKKIMQFYPDIELRTHYDYRPIHFACIGGRVPVIKELLRAGADIRHPTEDKLEGGGRTPLHQAASGGSAAAVEFVLGMGEDVNIQDDYGMTPLHIASLVGSVKAVRVLLEHHADPNIKTREQLSALHYAAWNSHASVAESLIDAGSSIDLASDDDVTALQLALSRFLRAMVILLFKRGTDLHYTNLYGLCGFDMALAQYHFSEDDLAVVQRRSHFARRTKLLDALLSVAKTVQTKPSRWGLDFSRVMKCLHLLHSHEDVQFGYQFTIEILSNGQLQHNSFCNICYPSGATNKGIIGYRYKCMVCFDVDLCETHMKEYEKKGTRLKNLCHKHSFLKIPKSLSDFDKEKLRAFGDEQKLEWLRGIEYRFAWERHTLIARDSSVVDVDWPVLRTWLGTKTQYFKASNYKLFNSSNPNSNLRMNLSTTSLGLPRFVGLFYQEFNKTLLALRFSQRLLQLHSDVHRANI